MENSSKIEYIRTVLHASLNPVLVLFLLILLVVMIQKIKKRHLRNKLSKINKETERLEELLYVEVDEDLIN